MRPMGCFLAMILFVAADAGAADAPPRVAELLQQMNAHSKARRLADAISAAEEAVSVHRAAVGNDDPALIPTLKSLAFVQNSGGSRRDALLTRKEIVRLTSQTYDPAHPFAREARYQLSVAERVDALSPEDFADLKKAGGRMARAFQAIDQGRKAEGCENLKEVLQVYSKKCGPACDEARLIRLELAVNLPGPDRDSVLVDLLTKDLPAVREAFGISHVEYAEEVSMLALSYVQLGDFAAAEKISREVIEAYRTTGCEDATSVMPLSQVLFTVYLKCGRFDDAQQVTLQCVDLIRQSKNPDPGEVAELLGLAAAAAYAKKDDQGAIRYFEESIAIREAAGPPTRRLGIMKQRLAMAHLRQNDATKAELVLKDSLKILRETGGESLPQAQLATAALGEIYFQRQEWGEAIPLLQAAHRHQKQTLGSTHETTRKTRDALVKSLRNSNRGDEADELLREPRPFVVPAAAP